MVPSSNDGDDGDDGDDGAVWLQWSHFTRALIFPTWVCIEIHIFQRLKVKHYAKYLSHLKNPGMRFECLNAAKVLRNERYPTEPAGPGIYELYTKLKILFDELL